ncbi:hypothetical protein BCY91_14295 [Pelobium manganitolerans]|uniref:Secretion system C-terminal sorting domain-containing protein n=1 Tax=Pelobium manganitolerans TaxID=1842495 RepID=A0A419S9Y8_9SPHI|nr:T9SS type A sorting domain-containing protein [Pelobium manganitolerans]RKD19042.1 hypothetical protein BCY91_14295 [Pelobium manganitolerans]
MRKTLLLTLGLGLLTSLGLSAQTIVSWNFYQQNNPASITASNINSNLESGASLNTISRGSSAASGSNANSFSTAGFGNDAINVANTDYFEIKLKSATGYKFSLSGINGKFKGTPGYGPVYSQFAYSIDEGNTFKLIGSPILTPMDANGEVDLPEQSLIGIPDLQNVGSSQSVVLRFYATGQTTNGEWGFYSPDASTSGLSIQGTTALGTPPVFATNFPAVENVNNTSFDVQTNINDKGNTYYVIVPDGAAAPTAEQVSKGLNADNTIATFSGSIYSEASTMNSKTVTGLSADVEYDVYVIAKDLSDNLQVSPVKIDIKTLAVPLPIELVAFTGTAYDGNITLNWNTASENKNDFFEIQHSADGKNFRSIGELKGAGTSKVNNAYNFIDENPNAGINYYRLVQHDFDGNTSASFVIALNSKIEGSKLNVYAGAEELKIFISSANQTKGELQIYEIGGKQLFSQAIAVNRGHNSISLPFSVDPGVHIVRFTSDSESLVKKFLR